MRLIKVLNFVLIMLMAGRSFGDLTSRPSPAEGPTVVKFHAFVVDLDGIDSASQSFDINLYCEFRWHDPRHSTSGDDNRTMPLDSLWHPAPLLVNQVFVRKSLPEVATVSSDGSVVYRQQYVGKLSQPLSLRDFPFDTQTLEILFASPQADPDQLVYQIDQDRDNGMSDHLSIPDWKVREWDLAATDYQSNPSSPPLSGTQFSITAERESDYYLIKVLVPLLLILVMACTVFWIHPKDGGVQIGVATSTMLTLIAYRFAIGSALPDIPYLTRMDIFILACTVLIVLCLIEVVITSRLAAEDQIGPALRLDRIMRVAFPVLVTLVTLYAFFLF